MKEAILSTATQLLNEQGIQRTTFRNIGAALDISDGHVRYYFKTKSELLLALLEKMDDEIMSNVTLMEGDASPMKGLQKSFMASFRVINRYAFVFLESPKVIANFPAFERALNLLYQHRRQFFTELFNTFQDKGIFKKNLDPAVLEKSYDQVFILSNSWIHVHHLIKRTPITDADMAYYSELVMMLFTPLLETDHT